jgi:hypothetical protein
MRHTRDDRLWRNPLARVTLVAAFALTLATVAITAAAGASARNTLTVCPAGPPECQFATVQEALSAAQDGDRILIAPGSYNAGLTINKSVSLIGSGATETTLSGGAVGVTVAGGSTVDIHSLTVADATDTGVVNLGTLTLAEITATHDGLTNIQGPCGVLNEGMLTVSHSAIRDNCRETSDPDVGGIENHGALTMRDSEVVHNRGVHVGGIENEGSATIIGSLIDDNVGMGPGNITNSGYLELRSSTISRGVCEVGCGLSNQNVALVVDSVVSGNSGLGSFGGPITNSGGMLTIRGSTIRANDGALGSPGAISNVAGSVEIERSTIVANVAFEGDAAIKNWGGMALRKSDVLGNSGGGGIENNGQMILQHSRVRDNVNSASFGPGGGGVHNLGTLTLEWTRVMDNTAQTIGGGILNEGSAELNHSFITHNTAVDGLDGLFGGGIYNTGTVAQSHTFVRRNIPDDCVGC